MRIVVPVDWNERAPGGELICARILPPDSWNVKAEDPVVMYESLDCTEMDGTIAVARAPFDGALIVYIRPQWDTFRDIHRCDTPCDPDCEEQYCHEAHQPPWKRNPGHPYPRIVDGKEETTVGHLSYDVNTTQGILREARRIWGANPLPPRRIAVCAAVITGDIARQARGIDEGTITSPGDIPAELGNMIVSAVRWCDDLGIDPVTAVRAALERQTAYVAESGH